jgi:hypothetical protein
MQAAAQAGGRTGARQACRRASAAAAPPVQRGACLAEQHGVLARGGSSLALTVQRGQPELGAHLSGNVVKDALADLDVHQAVRVVLRVIVVFFPGAEHLAC